MKKKTVLLVSALLALSVGAVGSAACGGEKHSLIDVPFCDATCTHQGRLAHQECTDCHKYFIDGKEVGESELVLPKDPLKHVLTNVEYSAATCTDGGTVAHDECSECGNYFVDGETVSKFSTVIEINPEAHRIENLAEVAATCGSDGMKQHDECVYCHKIYKDGAEADVSEFLIPKGGEHTFVGAALECLNCDAYKLLCGGEYFVIDSYALKPFVTGAEGAGYATGNKTAALADHVANPMTFGTQCNSGITAENVNEREWVLTNSNSGDVSGFTRFVAGKSDETAGYVGRYILTFDVTADVNTTFSRFGAQLTNSAGTLLPTTYQSKLIGTHNDADHRQTEFKAGITYRFAYAMETTAVNQITQIFDCFTGVAKVTVSNLHIVFLDGGTTGNVTARLLYFGEAENIAVAAEDCTHANAYNVTGTATCTQEGTFDHSHCPQCAKNFIDGAVTENLTGMLPHSLGDWQSNENDHWKECSGCHANFETAAHVPGEGATATTPQLCTECGYVIAPATVHQHTMEHNPYKQGACTENGNTEYWYCTGCEKYFEDANGDTEIEFVSTVIAAHHALTSNPAQNATCYTRGTDVAYSQCTVCGKYFTDGSNEISVSALFTKPLLEHSFGADGACTNTGCTAKKEAAEISVPATCFGSQGSVINPELVKNPGKWAAQTSSGSDASVDNGVLKIKIPSHSTDKKKTSFVRIIPSQNGADAFVGTYVWTFDFKVTEGLGSASGAESANIYVGFFIQSTTEEGNLGTIADANTTFIIGKTYRFSVIVETLNASQFVQFNIRNTAGSGASVEISNASYVFYPQATNTGTNILEKIAFAQLVAEDAAAAVAFTADAAIAEDKRYTVS